MARVCYILGAGASYTSGAPLMWNFIDRADELRHERNTPASVDDFNLFFDVLRGRLPRMHATSVVNLTNIEEIFGLVEMASLVGRLPDTEQSDIDRVVKATRRVLAETVELSCKLHSDGDRYWTADDYVLLADFLARSDGGDAAIITFNYDITLETALHFEGLSADYALEPAPPRSVPVLKLHGSLNWSACPSCGTVTPVDIPRVIKLSPPQFPPQTGLPWVIRPTQCLGGVDRHCRCAVGTSESQPAIVPPSWNKTQYHRSFEKVWQRAAKELGEAEQVIVIGYSMPPTDSFFRDLLALGLAGPTRLKRFEVVDPMPIAAERFQALLGPEYKHRFSAISEDFVSWARRRMTPPQNR